VRGQQNRNRPIVTPHAHAGRAAPGLLAPAVCRDRATSGVTDHECDVRRHARRVRRACDHSGDGGFSPAVSVSDGIENESVVHYLRPSDVLVAATGTAALGS